MMSSSEEEVHANSGWIIMFKEMIKISYFVCSFDRDSQCLSNRWCVRCPMMETNHWCVTMLDLIYIHRTFHKIACSLSTFALFSKHKNRKRHSNWLAGVCWRWVDWKKREKRMSSISCSCLFFLCASIEKLLMIKSPTGLIKVLLTLGD